MIICHRHKFIFIKTRKTAGTSLEIALSGICGPDDVITEIHEGDQPIRKALGYRGVQNVMLPYSKYNARDWARLLLKWKRRSYHSHISATEIKGYVGQATWDTYFKFTLERNPFDKVVSHYYWVDGPARFGSLANFVQSKEVLGAKGWQLYTINNKIAVDKVYLYEELDAVCKDLATRLDINDQLELPVIRTKGYTRPADATYANLFDHDSINRIRDIFKEEIESFGYDY